MNCETIIYRRGVESLNKTHKINNKNNTVGVNLEECTVVTHSRFTYNRTVY